MVQLRKFKIDDIEMFKKWLNFGSRITYDIGNEVYISLRQIKLSI